MPQPQGRKHSKHIHQILQQANEAQMLLADEVGKDEIKKDDPNQYPCIIDDTGFKALSFDDAHL